VIDLRDNGGGYLEKAVEVIDELLKDKELIVFTKNRKGIIDKTFATEGGIFEKGKVVVLIDENSASASEILAGAIQDNDRGIIVGRRSFGKGLVQREMGFEDGSAVRLTISRYYTPSGRSIQKPYTKGDAEKYSQDFENRFASGELYEKDKIKVADSLKFKTKKGRTVYGGGGIMPDIFNPQDSIGSSFYFTELRYTGAITQFSFLEWRSIGRKKYKSLDEFISSFQVSQNMIEKLVIFSDKEFKIKRDDEQIEHSKRLIERYLKAEIARQIWIEQGFFKVTAKDDSDIQRALKYFKMDK
jgi:carboxyl-terminal processing protease